VGLQSTYGSFSPLTVWFFPCCMLLINFETRYLNILLIIVFLTVNPESCSQCSRYGGWRTTINPW
jgi:hypothetical protein